MHEPWKRHFAVMVDMPTQIAFVWIIRRGAGIHDPCREKLSATVIVNPANFVSSDLSSDVAHDFPPRALSMASAISYDVYGIWANSLSVRWSNG